MGTATHLAPDAVFAWLDDTARRLERAGLTRRMRARASTDVSVNLAGNDYLGLARHPAVVEAAAAATRRWGVGSTAARLVTGTTQVHQELEEELAAFCGCEASVVFTSGYLANLGAIAALCRPESLVVIDAHSHASLIDGTKLSGAKVVAVAHNDAAAAGVALAERGRRRALMATESVFSVDGDAAPLSDLQTQCRAHGAALLIDDAHGFGVVGDHGQGAAAAAGMAGQPDVVIVLTLGKALGSQGGVMLGPRRVIDHVVSVARTFLFDTALAPACAAGALAAVRVLREDTDRPARARGAATGLAERLAAQGLPVTRPTAAVVSVRAPSAEAGVAWAGACRSRDVVVGCFRPPSVPDRFTRLRLSAWSELSEEDLDRAVQVISETSPW